MVGPASASDVWQLLEKLPSELQASVFSCLASTPSCPGPVLMACVSKRLGALVEEHLGTAGARADMRITLEVSCGEDTPRWQRKRQAGRLASLAAWLCNKGHLLASLQIISKAQPRGSQLQQYPWVVLESVPDIMAALAAVGQRHGGLRLHHLSLPAAGNTPLATISATLTACPQLKQLDLGHGYSETVRSPDNGTKQDLAAALGAMTQLTSLRLHGALFRHYTTLHHLAILLPSSLLVLELGSSRHDTAASGPPLLLSPTSLQHLTALQQLTLGANISFNAANLGASSSSSSPCTIQASPLAALTALTSLDYAHALQPVAGQAGGELEYSLLAPPNLVTLRAETCATPGGLQLLASTTSLRALTLLTDPDANVPRAAQHQGGGPLAQLTQVTCLELLLKRTPRSWRGPQLQAWCDVLPTAGQGSSLCHLTLSAPLLGHVDLAPLADLTHLRVDAILDPPTPPRNEEEQLLADEFGPPWSPEAAPMAALLQRLAPLAGGVLMEVEVVGVGAPDVQATCWAAVTGVVGEEVAVVFS